MVGKKPRIIYTMYRQREPEEQDVSMSRQEKTRKSSNLI
jgi:hypothetical protein